MPSLSNALDQLLAVVCLPKLTNLNGILGGDQLQDLGAAVLLEILHLVLVSNDHQGPVILELNFCLAAVNEPKELFHDFGSSILDLDDVVPSLNHRGLQHSPEDRRPKYIGNGKRLNSRLKEINTKAYLADKIKR